MTVGFIGFGRIAQATAQGMIRGKAIAAKDVFAYAVHPEKLRGNCRSLGIVPKESIKALVKASDLLVLATPIQAGSQVLKDLLKADWFWGNHPLLSFVAGASVDPALAELKEKKGIGSIRIIPNIPVESGEGIFVCDRENTLSEADKKTVFGLLYHTGKVVLVSHAHWSVCGTLAGCGPALIAIAGQALVEAGIQHGISASLSKELVAQMLLGTGKALLESGEFPKDLMDRVATPNGTTAKGISVLSKNRVGDAMKDAVNAIEGE